MLRLVRLTVLAAILATSSQTSSAQKVEDIHEPTEIYCPDSYEFTPVRQHVRGDIYVGEWDNGKVIFPFLKWQLKKSGGIWDIACLYGFVEHAPNGGIREYQVHATLVRRIRAGNCAKVQNNPYVMCHPPTDPGLDVYQSGSGTSEPPPPDRGLDVYQPGSETPQSPPPADPGVDVSQAGSGTPPPLTIDRGVDVYQPSSVPPRGSKVRPKPPPPPPEN